MLWVRSYYPHCTDVNTEADRLKWYLLGSTPHLDTSGTHPFLWPRPATFIIIAPPLAFDADENQADVSRASTYTLQRPSASARGEHIRVAEAGASGPAPFYQTLVPLPAISGLFRPCFAGFISAL